MNLIVTYCIAHICSFSVAYNLPVDRPSRCEFLGHIRAGMIASQYDRRGNEESYSVVCTPSSSTRDATMPAAPGDGPAKVRGYERAGYDYRFGGDSVFIAVTPDDTVSGAHPTAAAFNNALAGTPLSGN